MHDLLRKEFLRRGDKGFACRNFMESRHVNLHDDFVAFRILLYFLIFVGRGV